MFFKTNNLKIKVFYQWLLWIIVLSILYYLVHKIILNNKYITNIYGNDKTFYASEIPPFNPFRNN